ncbi:hypothetical protein CF327_g3233 [Tilletia walkeri]|nr:hypothetical protein CF327_g3233 [Tilletia walkeri]
MPTPPLSSPDSLFSSKSGLSIDSVTTSGNSSFSGPASSSISSQMTSPPGQNSDLKQQSARSIPSMPGSSTSPPPPGSSSQGAQMPTSNSSLTVAAAVAAAAKRRRAQTEVQRLPLRLPLLPSGSMSGNMASYGNAVTQLVPPRRLERAPVAAQPDNDLAGAKGEADAITGRRRIQIGYITNEARRASTFKKRKAGLLKKAYELAELTGSHVLVVAVNDQGKCYSFATPSLQPMVTHPEGQTLLKRCLANGQTGNDSTAFDSSQAAGEHSGFGVVESLPDEDDDEDDDDDSDGDAEMVQPQQPAKNRLLSRRGKGHALSHSVSDRSLSGANRGTGPILNSQLASTAGMDMSQTLSGNYVPLKPVFLSSATTAPSSGHHSHSSSMSWSPFSHNGQSTMDYTSPPNSAPPHIVAFDQATVAHNQMLGMLTPTTSSGGPTQQSTQVPAEANMMPEPSLPASRPPLRFGRARAATMLNPIELHPLPSDSMATTAYLMGRDLPSPVNALALNLGSAYIGAGAGSGDATSGIGLGGMHVVDGSGPVGQGHHTRTFEVQSSGLGRPRSLTTFPSHQTSGNGEGLGVMPSALWNFDPSLVTGAFPTSTTPSSERPMGSGTLGKRKLSMDVSVSNANNPLMSATQSGLTGDNSNSLLVTSAPIPIPSSSNLGSDTMMMQQDDMTTSRKVPRRKGATSPGTGTSPMRSSDFPLHPRAFGRTRSYTLGNPMHHLGLGDTAEVTEDEAEHAMEQHQHQQQQQQQQDFGPSFLHTSGTNGAPGGLFNPPGSSSTAVTPANVTSVDPFAAAAAAAMGGGMDQFGTGNMVAAAPRTLVSSGYDGTGGPFSGMLMGDPSSGGMFDTLNFGGVIPAHNGMLGGGGEPTLDSTNNNTIIQPGSVSSPMTSNGSGTGSVNAQGPSTDFLHRLHQQYKEHHDVQLHQHQELQRHYAELTAAVVAAGGGGGGGSGASGGGNGMSASGTPQL